MRMYQGTKAPVDLIPPNQNPASPTDNLFTLKPPSTAPFGRNDPYNQTLRFIRRPTWAYGVPGTKPEAGVGTAGTLQ